LAFFICTWSIATGATPIGFEKPLRLS